MHSSKNGIGNKDRYTRRLAMWDVTYVCNIACKHCYNYENVSQKNERENNFPLTFEESKKIVDELKNKNFSEINLAGGEPLLLPYIEQLVNYINECGLTASINTNGLLLNKNMADKFARQGFSNFSFSIAGISEETNSAIRGHGNLDLLIKNIDYLCGLVKQRNLKNGVSLNYSVSKMNIYELGQLYNFCLRHKIPSVNIHTIQPMGSAIKNTSIIESDYENILLGYENLLSNWGEEVSLIIDAKPLLAEYFYKKYGIKKPKYKIVNSCPAHNYNVYVSPVGQIIPCKLLSVSEESFQPSSLVNIDKYELISNPSKLLAQSKTYPICKTCKYNKECAPCPLLSWDGDDQECIVAKKYLDLYEEEIMFSELDVVSNAKIVNKDDEFLLISDKRKFRISESGSNIWNMITPKKTVFNLVKDIQETTSISNEDVLEFVYALRNLGLLSINNKCTIKLPITCMLICCAR